MGWLPLIVQRTGCSIFFTAGECCMCNLLWQLYDGDTQEKLYPRWEGWWWGDREGWAPQPCPWGSPCWEGQQAEDKEDLASLPWEQNNSISKIRHLGGFSAGSLGPGLRGMAGLACLLPTLSLGSLCYYQAAKAKALHRSFAGVTFMPWSLHCLWKIISTS